MKKHTILIINALALVGLAGCSTSAGSSSLPSSSSSSVQEGDPEILNLINAVKNTSHKIKTSNTVYVNQVDSYAIDQYLRSEAEYTYSYANNGERAIKIKKSQVFADLVKGTHDIQTDAYGNEILTTYDNGEKLYFRDVDTGVVLSEALNAKNEVDIYIQSDYDYQTAVYTPIIFDEEFRNPFDFFVEEDITKVSANTFSLNKDKAAFALDCYGSIGVNAVTGCTILTDNNGKPTKMDFETIPDGGEGYSYSRETHFSVTFLGLGESFELSHVTPMKNDNPALENALHVLDNATSYRYAKDYYDANGEIEDHIVGYITQEAAYYHHHDDPSDTHGYEMGDDYDYIAAICAENNKYYGYEYSYGEPKWGWDLIMVSSSAAYSIDSFSGLGPSFSDVSSKIFSPKPGRDNVYICEDEQLLKTLGAYFDFQFIGVKSTVLETNTDRLEITIEEDGSLKIDTGYAYAEHGYTATKRIVYHLYADSLNNTTLPSYVEVPDTTGDSKW